MTDIPRPKPEPKRGWKKLFFALFVFVFAPAIPQLRALLPVDETMLLFVPAIAACALVGWWAGGRALSALLWAGIAFIVTRQGGASTGVFANLLRGWTLLLAGTFGIACLFGPSRPFFTRALGAVGATFALALLMSLFAPAAFSGASGAVAAEFAQRNSESLDLLHKAIAQWGEKVPSLGLMQEQTEQQLNAMAKAGQLMFPALLALQSLAALALAWAAYHRLSRQRIGAPLAPLRDFRFKGQLVWGLRVGLVNRVLPSRGRMRGLGANLVLFFGALYAVRGLGVLAWFMAPSTFAMTLIAGAVLVFVPVIQVVALLGFMTLGITALGLGVGDTWADWRGRARSTLS
jgi:hypothetical protein